MSIRPLPPPVVGKAPPLPRRIRLKIQRIFLDLTGPEVDREWRRAWSSIDSVEGWLLEGQERWLFDAARSLPSPANIVEIGSFKGRSTCCLASGCRGTKKRVYAVDTFDGNECDFPSRNFFDEFTENVRRCGLSDYVMPVVGVSWETAKDWRAPIHLLFIDGSHRYEDVLADFEGFFPHVVPGGLVAFHDVGEEAWPDVLRVWDESAKHRLTGTGQYKSLAFGRKPLLAGAR